MQHNPKIHVSVYGSGLGHAARTSKLLAYLKERCIIYSTSWGEGRAYLNRLGYDCREIPQLDVGWGDQDRMSFKKTVRGLPTFYGTFGLQIYREIEIMKQESPQLVISDSRLSSIIAASYLGIPSVLLTNQLRINLPVLTGKMMRFLERVNGESLAAFWISADAIIVPDLPPPYTISQYSLSPLRLTQNRLTYVGLFAGAKNYIESNPNRDRPKVFFSLTGPLVSRRWIKPLMLKAARMLADTGRVDVVFSSGNPEGSQLPEKIGKLLYYEWCPDTDAQIQDSDLVVTRSGHSTISKLVVSGKPSVLIPIPMHGEQWGNAKKCQELGIARAFDQLSTSSSKLFEGIVDAINDQSLKKSAERVREIAVKHDGVRNAVGLLQKMLQ
ncbi:MAG: glycosyltransferase [Conexivisphaerales archaeon]